ncbi:MAG: DUF6049 family protein [Acidimicrobiales bacterium]
MERISRLLTAAAVVLLALCGSFAAAVGATQAPTSARSAAGAIDFVSQTPWHVGDQPSELRVRLGTRTDPATLELALAFYPRITSRSEFAQTLEGRVQRAALNLQRFPLVDLVADPTGVITVPLSPPVTRQGVYPIRVELRDPSSGDVIDALTTYLVHIPAPIEGDRLGVGLTVPFAAPAATLPDGSFQLDAGQQNRLAGLAATIAAASIPFTVVARGETLDALGNTADATGTNTLTALAGATSGRVFVPQHYVGTRLPALLRGDLSSEADTQAQRAAAAVSSRLPTAQLAADTWISDIALDREALAYLRGRGITNVVVPETTFEPLDLPITLTQTFAVRTDAGRLTAAASDAGLRGHFVSSVAPALAAHQLLADLSVLYFDRPGLSRGVAVVPPDSWEADPAMLRPLLDGLASSPILQSQTSTTFFNQTPVLETNGEPDLRSLADLPAERLVFDPSRVRAARNRIDSLVSVLTPFNPIIERLDRTLLTSESAVLRPTQRTALLTGTDRQIDAVLAQIRMPAKRSITLTAREGEIPVSIGSDIPHPIRATIRLRSGTLGFPDGDSIPVELTRSNLTQLVKVRANTSGSFPLRVQLVSPDGNLVLGETRVTVRSTAVSGVGVALTAGAFIFLALWWARHLRGQRSKRLVPT